MTKTLIIKEADFSENKIETVTIIEPVPCTGISLSESSASVVYGGSYTAVPTVIPANTTDEIVWTSNNENFTVNNGVVTIGGVGQAVITATCGSHSASVTLTSTATLDIDDFDVANGMNLTFVSDYCALTKISGGITIGRVSETDYHTLWSDADTRAVGETFAPAIIPPGSTQMKITYTDTKGQGIAFADMSTESSAGYGAVEIVEHDENYVTATERTLTIPEGADGYYVAFRSSSFTFGIVFS